MLARPKGSVRVTEGRLEGERELVEAAKTSREAFGLLYDRYVRQVYGYAYARTGSHHDAEDITAETFRRALAHIGEYCWQGNPYGAYLHRIAANLLVSRHRRDCPVEPLDEELPLVDDDPQPEEAVVARAEAGSLWAAVAGLPHDQRQAIVLRFSHGLKVKEIAGKMDRSEGAVKQLLYRAMLALRETLQGEGGDG